MGISMGRDMYTVVQQPGGANQDEKETFLVPFPRYERDLLYKDLPHVLYCLRRGDRVSDAS
jgi:hypothetical protein